jgi:hypothetical protein
MRTILVFVLGIICSSTLYGEQHSIRGSDGQNLIVASLDQASIQGVSGDVYGPDNKNSLLPLQALPLEVPDGKQAFLTFSFQANWENAIIIYKLDAPAGRLVRRMRYGTYSPLNDNPNPLTPGTYYITGWHKEVHEGQTSPWSQSIAAYFNSADRPQFYFEDDPDHRTSTAYDWNDAWLIVAIR